MSALPPKADIIPHCIKCLLLAKSGHGGNKTAAAEKLQIDFGKERGGLRMVIAIAQERAIT